MGTLVCRAELDKHDGIILTVENGDDGITQTIVMDGTSITTTVEGPVETSTITQKQDSIAINCKTFTLDAETITCKSTMDTKHESVMAFDIQSGTSLDVTATADATYKALNSTIESTVQTGVKGKILDLEGTASAELKGAKIKVESKGLLDLITSGVATVKGSLIKLTGILKIG
jgi:hypothetical protein